jgi:hypothetical protein
LDPSALVRKTYVQFLGRGVAQPAVTAAVIKPAAGSVGALLTDASPLVAAAAVRAASSVLQAALAVLALQVGELARHYAT